MNARLMHATPLLVVASSKKSQALVVKLVIAGEMLLEVVAPRETLVAVMFGAQRAVNGRCDVVLDLAMTLERVWP